MAYIPPTSGGFTIESGTFTRNAGDGSGAQIVTTLKKAKLLFFTSRNTDDTVAGSSGNTDGIINSCIFIDATPVARVNDTKSIISANSDIGPRFEGSVAIANTTDTSFQVDWLEFFGGRNTSVQWYGIMEA